MADVTVKTVTTDYDKSIPREVDKQLSLVAYTDTPFYTSLRMETCTSLNPEKLEDKLSDAAENKAVEGADYESIVVDAPLPLDNRVQRLTKTFKISQDLEHIKKYARKSEFNRIQGLKTQELARDIEYAMLNGTKTAGTDSVAAEMDGALKFVGAGNTYDFGGTFADTNHITEDILLDVLQAMFEKGAKPDTVLAPPAQKRKISRFTDKGRITINADSSKKELTMAVNILETDFGTVSVIPELFIEPEIDNSKNYDSLVIYDATRFACKTFRPLERTELARNGDARKWAMSTSKTILPDSKKTVGSITKLTRVKVA